MSIRQRRVAELIKAEISRILASRARDPDIGFVTVTHVELSPDLRYAKVFVSVLGPPDQQRDTMKALERAQPFVRAEVAHTLELRYAPEIVFQYDASVERGARVFELLSEIEHEQKQQRNPEQNGQQ